jgi:hypothetical protein
MKTKESKLLLKSSFYVADIGWTNDWVNYPINMNEVDMVIKEYYIKPESISQMQWCYFKLPNLNLYPGVGFIMQDGSHNHWIFEDIETRDKNFEIAHSIFEN